MAAQNISLSFATLILQIIVERIQTRKARHWRHEVTAGIAHQSLDLTFVTPLTGAAIPIPDRIMRQHRVEPLCSLAFAIPHDLRNQAGVIVLEYRLRHRAEEHKRMYMAEYCSTVLTLMLTASSAVQQATFFNKII